MVQHLHALAGIVADGRDPSAGALALAEAAARALPGATAYVVLAPPLAGPSPCVAGAAGPRSDAVPRGILGPERFELAALETGQCRRGTVPDTDGMFYAAAPVAAVGAAPAGVLVAVADEVLADDAVDALAALGALGAVFLARGAAPLHSRLPPPEWEALAVDLQRSLAAGLDEALPGVLARLSESLGALGAWCLLLDPVTSDAEVAASVGAAGRDPAPRPDRALVQRLLASRTVARLAPAEAPALAVAGSTELLVVPLVTQDAVLGALVFGCPRPAMGASLAVLMAEPIATAVLRSRTQDSGAALAAEWDRALSHLDAPLWLTDVHHRVRRANRAARLRLDAAGNATCRDVLGAQCPEACGGTEPVAAVVDAPGGRYLVRAVPLPRGGALYVALPRVEDVTADAVAQHVAAAGDLALAAVVEAETPLAGLGAVLASLLQDVGRGAGAKVLEDRLRVVWQGVNHLRESVAASLGYLRRGPGDAEPCELPEILHHAVAVARARVRAPGDYHLEVDELPVLWLDRGRLLAALLAMMPDGGAAVTVRARALDDEVEIRVDGGGATLSPLTERVARELGGWMLADAAGGVMLRLPRRRAGMTERATPVPMAGVGPDTEVPPPDRRARVLLVDDEPFILRAYARVLAPRHEVVTAADGAEALTRLASGSFDAIVTDVMMPRRSGLDLYSEVAQRWPTMLPRIVFMTGAVFGSEAEDFLQTISNPVLRKPIDPEVLREAVAEVLERAGGW